MNPSQDLLAKMQEIALHESAYFILNEMADARAFDNGVQLMTHALSQAELRSGGLICEFGVWQGTSVNRLAALAGAATTIYGFDSFEGLPEKWRDGFDRGSFRMESLPIVAPNVELVVGWFHEVLPDFLTRHPQPVTFVHIDCDLYSSAKTVLDLLSSRLQRGAVLLFDEFFNYPRWKQGEYRAFCEFIASSGFDCDWLGYSRFHEQVAVRLK